MPSAATTARQAVADIADGSRVFVGSAAGVPQALVAALLERCGNGLHTDLIAGYLLRPLPVCPPSALIISVQPSPALWATRAQLVDVAPVRYSDYATIFRPGGPLPLDVALVQVSSPGPDGRYSLGISVGGARPAVRAARHVIAQVNRHMPYTFGDGEISGADIDVVVERDEPLTEYSSRPPGDRASALAARVAGQVPATACVQLGIGSVPGLVGDMLAGRSLAVHTGMLSDWSMGLQHSAEPMITAEIVGSRRLYDWVHRNPAVRTAEADRTHKAGPDPGAGPFFAINSGLQVALDGAVNAEVLGSRVLSGPGGLPDFAALAAARDDSASIVMISAASASGESSNIVARLAAGTPVTLPAWMADRIVTESGSAHLRGLPHRQRADALIAAALPQFRDDLAAIRASN
jgi:4-hydroxybutyrate CoA-transferase